MDNNLSNTKQDDSKKKRQSKISKLRCNFCHRTFKYEDALQEHEKEHKLLGGTPCRYCNLWFETKEKLHHHVEQTHRAFKCRLCKDLIFDNEENYLKHIKEDHEGMDMENKICENCGKTFSTSSKLSYHKITSCGKAFPFKCNFCEKGFKSLRILQDHIYIHTGEKRFGCTYCPDRFRTKIQVVVHERKHTGEKPFKCEICSKAFSHRESLVTHSTTHTGLKPYLCECCGARFSCVSSILAHRRTRPDTCGQPQYCTKLSKACPRATFKKTDEKASEERIKRNVCKIIKKTADPVIPKTLRGAYAYNKLDHVKKFKNEKARQRYEKKKTLEETSICKNNQSDGNSTDKELELESKIVSTTTDERPISIENMKVENIIVENFEDIETKLCDINDESINNETSILPFECVSVDLKTIDNTGDQKPEEFENFQNIGKIELTDDFPEYNSPACNPIFIKETSKTDIKIEETECKEGLQNSCEDNNHKDDQKLYECLACEPRKIYKTLRNYQRHLKEHVTDVDNFNKTDEAETVLPNFENLENKNVHKYYECFECGPLKIYTNLMSYKRHLGEHVTGIKKINKILSSAEMKTATYLICPVCSKKFTEIMKFRSHITFHGNEDFQKYFRCSVCSKRFTSKEDRTLHMEKDHETGIVCTICNKKYKNIRSLREHNKYIHLQKHISKKNKPKALFICNKCGKNFNNKTYLTNHEISNCGNINLFECKICGKGLSGKAALKNHMMIHTGELPYTCSHCGKGFIHLPSCKVHERSHTGEKPYVCTYCKKGFAYRENLLIHLSTHDEGMKRYQCKTCGDRFSCITGLKGHWKTRKDTCGMDPDKSVKSSVFIGFRNGEIVVNKKKK